jgi:hypothetical protein
VIPNRHVQHIWIARTRQILLNWLYLVREGLGTPRLKGRRQCHPAARVLLNPRLAPSQFSTAVQPRNAREGSKRRSSSLRRHECQGSIIPQNQASRSPPKTYCPLLRLSSEWALAAFFPSLSWPSHPLFICRHRASPIHLFLPSRLLKCASSPLPFPTELRCRSPSTIECACARSTRFTAAYCSLCLRPSRHPRRHAGHRFAGKNG